MSSRLRIGLVMPPAVFLIDDRAFLYLAMPALGALARREGHDVEILDLTGHSRTCPKQHHDDQCAKVTLEDSCKRIADLATRSDVLCFYSMAALHCFVSKFLAPAKEANPHCVCVLGGPHASTASERCAAEGWDYVVVADQGGGGGEPGFLEVLRRVAEKQDKPSKPPLREIKYTLKSLAVIQDGRERIIRVGSRDPKYAGTKLDYSNDRWPWPDRGLPGLDFDSYRYELDGRRYASIVTQAGCPYACNFCAHFEGYRKLVLRSPEHVRAEIREIKSRWPWVGGVMMYDDEVNLRLPDFEEFLRVIGEESRSLDLRFRAFFKCHSRWMTDDLFARMKAAGFDYLCTGAESAHPDVMKHIGKGATVEDNTAFVRLCVKHGIKPKVFTMVGQVGERPDTAEALAKWLENMAAEGLTDADCTVMTPSAGTPILENSDYWLKTGLIQFDKAELESNADTVNYKGRPGEYKSFVSTPWMTREDIVWWRDHIERRFRAAAGLPALVGGKDDG